MEIEVGKKTDCVKKVLIPYSKLRHWSSVKGSMYEIQVKFKNYINENQAKRIIREIPKMLSKYGAKVKYMKIGDNYVNMEVSGSPFEWETVLNELPSIFRTIGLIVSVIAVLLIIQKSAWDIIMLMFGLMLLFGIEDLSKKKESENVKRHKIEVE